MKITILNENPYSQIICNYLTQSFPKVFKPNKTTLLEIITDLMVGTKENRYGPIPVPESLVVIREVISSSIEDNKPIPVLVPWGGIKADMSSTVDIAEVGAIMQLINLDNAIKEIYPPGLYINIRIEDTGAYWLYRSETEIHELAIADYTEKFTRLVDILIDGNGRMPTNSLHPIPESTFMEYDEYEEFSNKVSRLLFRYLLDKRDNPEIPYEELDAWKDLQSIGWLGEIPQEQQDYYITRYRNLYPGKTRNEYLSMLTDYLGGALARYKLNGRCAPSDKYIQISFVPPVPGAPATIFNNSLYWRSLSLSNARSHIAPWRAKGYLKIEGNDVKMKMTHFGDHKVFEELISETITLEDETGLSVEINADYIIA